MNPDILLLLIGTCLPWFTGPLSVHAPGPRSTLKAAVPNVVPRFKPAHCIDEVLAGQMEPCPVDRTTPPEPGPRDAYPVDSEPIERRVALRWRGSAVIRESRVPLPRGRHQLLESPSRPQALEETIVPGEVDVVDPAADPDRMLQPAQRLIRLPDERVRSGHEV
jgi:hypothetical protein